MSWSCLQGLSVYSLSNLFPYVGYMVAGFLGDHADGAGYAAGYVTGAFFVGRFLSSYLWGFASDRIGRKPVLLITLVSTVIGSILFGISQDLVWAIATRLLMGLTSAASIIGRAIVPELCGPEGVVEGMALITGSFAVGLTLGPAFGGLLSEPARHFPSLFPPDGFFARYPYVLPNLMGSLGALICIPLVILYVPETKKRKSTPPGELSAQRPLTPVSTPIHKRGDGTNYNMLPKGAGEKTPSAHRRSLRAGGASPLLLAHGRLLTSPMRQPPLAVEEDEVIDVESEVTEIGATNLFGKGGLLQVRHVPLLLVATALMEIIIVAFDEVYPLWAISSIRAGGLNWDIMRVGQVLFLGGVGQALMMFVAYAWVVKYVGLEACHQGAGVLAALLTAAIPLIGYLRCSESVLIVVSSITIALVNSASYTLYTAVMVSATNPVPPRLRGRLAGIMTAAQGFGGAVSPGPFAILFAWSISRTSTADEIPFVDQHVAFNLCALLRIALLGLVWKFLTQDSLTDVVEDPPTPQWDRAPSTELEAIGNGDGHGRENMFLSIEDKRSEML